MGGIIDGIKWGIILQLGVAVVLPAVMPMIGNLSGTLGNLGGGGGGGGQQQPIMRHQGGRPYGYDEGWY